MELSVSGHSWRHLVPEGCPAFPQFVWCPLSTCQFPKPSDSEGQVLTRLEVNIRKITGHFLGPGSLTSASPRRAPAIRCNQQSHLSPGECMQVHIFHHLLP
ncbi:hypothetical protein GN956_G7353 [Arapaima gigas]